MMIKKELELQSTREAFGQALVQVAMNDPRVVVLSADLSESLRLNEFKRQFPSRFIECGVAEQNMMSVAAGLALAGKVPFVCSFAVFNPGLNLSQLRIAAYSQLPIKVIGGHAGISTGEDGATHQALEDLALTSSMPNLTVSIPTDAVQAKQLTKSISKIPQASYLRLGREKLQSVAGLLKELNPDSETRKIAFVFNQAQQLSNGKDLTIIANGLMVQEVIKAAIALKKIKISCEIINLHTIKPLDIHSIVESVKKTRAVLIAAEHQVNSGTTALVSAALINEYGQGIKQSIVVETLGVNDSFGESGKAEDLLAKYDLNSAGIIKKVRTLLAKKKILL